MIPSGVVVVHNNGKLARVIFPPSEHDSRVGVAFWIDETAVMQMAWHVEWIVDWWDDQREWLCHDTVDYMQLELW